MTGSPITLTVVGLGLIGGSLVRAVKANALPYRVVGVARREETRTQARESGAVDESLGTVSADHFYADNGLYVVTVTVTESLAVRPNPSLTVTVAV